MKQGFTAAANWPWLVAIALLLSFFWQLGAVPLYDLDEGAFTEATREMIASGNYITPHKDGEPRYDKPVLIYWAQAASVHLLGLDEFALRLPSAIAASLWAIALWLFVAYRLDRTTATVAALVMILSLETSLIAKAAVADALLNLFIILSFFEIYRYYLDPRRILVLRAFLWMALGFLTKGPIALFFPVVVSFLFFLTERSLKDWLKAAFDPLGWLVFAAVALPWYLLIYIDNGSGFFVSFFLRHNIGRFESPMHGHGGFIGYYAIVLPIVLLPFTGWFIRTLTLLRSQIANPLDRFLWLWAGAVFILFSFSGTKLPHYMLYGATPLFILMARYRDRLTNPWLAFVPPLLFFALLFVLPDGLELARALADRAHQIAMFDAGLDALDASYRWAVGLALVAVLAVLAIRRPIWQRLIAIGFIQVIIAYGIVVPRVFEVMQEPVKEAAMLARRLDRPTVVYRTNMPSFSVYRQAITPAREPRPGDLVFSRVDKLDKLAAQWPDLEQTILYQRGPVALVDVREKPKH